MYSQVANLIAFGGLKTTTAADAATTEEATRVLLELGEAADAAQQVTSTIKDR